MAQIPNSKAMTEGDGLNDYFNVNTLNQRVELPNGAALRMFSDAYVTTTLQLANGTLNLAQSATAPAIANAGTITTAGVGVARVSPAGAVTGVILQAGTVGGQLVLVINEATSANSITMAASGTSNVADGTSDVIAGGIARLFVYDSSTNLWYKVA